MCFTNWINITETCEMVVRRKWKKLILLAFITALLVKIHHDYQTLNTINGKRQFFLYHIMNNSRPSKTNNLYNVNYILTQTDTVKKNDQEVNRPTSEIPPSLQSDVAVQTVLATGEDLKNVKPENLNHEVNGSGGDSRLYYNRSFKIKMEEVSKRIAQENQDIDGKSQAKPTITKTETNNSHDQLTNINNKTDSISNNIHNIKNVQPVLRENLTNLKKNATYLAKHIIALQNQVALSKIPSNVIPVDTKKKAAVFKVSHVVDSSEISLSESDIVRIKQKIEIVNDVQFIHNERRLGPLLDNGTVFVIQVHSRLENLKYLVESLRRVEHINSSLVIFSHDLWDDKINDFIASIVDFRVMQIFFPYSIQINPKSFPGRDPRDCVWNQKIDKKNPGTACLNSKWPDSYGHFREAAFTQIKHHWWWKLVRVFDHLRALKEFKGQVMFLEEDHYILPDILHVLKLLVKEREKSFKNHLVLGLGNYQKQAGLMASVVDRGDWIVNKYNLGFAFDRRIYEIIKKCQKDFCSYDDYNWDWTLAFMGKSCAKDKFAMLSMKVSRVLHVGSCGTHTHKKNCNLEKEVSVARARINGLQKFLFPKSLNIQKNFKLSTKPKKSNGGWGDLRDKLLCLSIVNGTQPQQVL